MQITVDSVDIDARFAALTKQRDQAMNQVVYLEGAVAQLNVQINELRAAANVVDGPEIAPEDVIMAQPPQESVGSTGDTKGRKAKSKTKS